MRHSLIALSLLSSMFPALSFAAPTGAACAAVDREALVALKLGNAKAQAEHKDVPGSKNMPKIGIDICTFTAQDAPLPVLTVTTTALPPDAKAAAPSCEWKPVPGVGVEIAVCNATVKSTFVSFAMTTKGSFSSAMKTTLRSHMERLVNRLGGLGAGATPR